MRVTGTQASERGSVVIAMSVLMVVLLGGTALLLRSQASLRASSVESSAAVADAGAEFGVAEVLARLEAGERGTLSDGGSLGDASYRYEATEIDGTTYVVRAQGSADGVTRSVEATLGGTADPFTLFVASSGRLEAQGTVSGSVATNGSLRVANTTFADPISLYGSSASCSGCASTAVFGSALDVPLPVLPTGTTRSCPTNGQFTGTIDGRGGVPYVCDPDAMTAGRNSYGEWLIFSGTVTVSNPPLVVYVMEDLNVAVSNSRFNVGGEPEDAQIIALGESSNELMDVYNSTLVAQMYGPGRDSWLRYANMTGQFAHDTLRTFSGRSVWIQPGGTAASTPTSWTVSSWERVPSN